MTNNYAHIKNIDEWLFFYDSEERVWHAVLIDDYIANIKNPEMTVPTVTSSYIADLMFYITTPKSMDN